MFRFFIFRDSCIIPNRKAEPCARLKWHGSCSLTLVRVVQPRNTTTVESFGEENMKYSKRELKSFNIFALFMFGLGGVFFTWGAIELAVQPRVEYVISESRREADSVSQTVSTNTPAVNPRKYAQRKDDRITVEGTNFLALSNTLLGAVFMALSFALNRVLLRVLRHNGEDLKSKLLHKKRR